VQQTACLLGGLPSLHSSRQANCESRAATRRALDGEVAAHHLAEAPADGEAKPCATVLARRRRGSLGKLLEQLAHLFRRLNND
jgi:hypothetical protein